MSNFPVPDYVAESAARLEKMSREFGETLPKEMAAAINLMSHPAAGMAAMTALGFGLAGQMLGLWVGAVAGAAEASQRLFVPLAPEAGGRPAAGARPSATVTNIASAKPVLKVVPKPEPAPKIVAKVAPAPKIVAKVEPVAKVVAKPEPEPKTVAKAEPVKKAAVKTAPAKPAATKVAPAKPAVAKAAPAKPVAAPAAKASTALLPEDFRQPRRLEQPAAPDDLKAISGVGPKLEKVLNELGVWTYAQIAGWSAEEVAWVDDYLSFAGRIGRDKWIEQAAALAAASATKPAKG